MISTLYGADHPDLDQIADVAVDGAMAIALSRGRYPKGYAHMDPNEDAVLGAVLPGGRLLVVADGHNGVEAAHAAVRAVAQAAPAILAADVADAQAAVEDLCLAARQGVATELEAAPVGRAESRTALSIALITDAAVHSATWGDTTVIVLRSKPKIVSSNGPFLGARTPLPEVSRTKVREGGTVAVVSDGVSDYLGGRWTQTLADAVQAADTVREAARAVVEAAMRGGAGDNVAVALTDV